MIDKIPNQLSKGYPKASYDYDPPDPKDLVERDMEEEYWQMEALRIYHPKRRRARWGHSSAPLEAGARPTRPLQRRAPHARAREF
ncbi:MAG: hypothetical protein ACKPKO_05850, partial [Candidatus Fonsibacter sp.]